jgi:hypothetical protein
MGAVEENYDYRSAARLTSSTTNRSESYVILGGNGTRQIFNGCDRNAGMAKLADAADLKADAIHLVSDSK